MTFRFAATAALTLAAVLGLAGCAGNTSGGGDILPPAHAHRRLVGKPPGVDWRSDRAFGWRIRRWNGTAGGNNPIARRPRQPARG